MCVVPFNATFIAPLVTAVTYVYVCNKMGKVGESVYINKTIEIDIYVSIDIYYHIHIHIYQTLNHISVQVQYISVQAQYISVRVQYISVRVPILNPHNPHAPGPPILPYC